MSRTGTRRIPQLMRRPSGVVAGASPELPTADLLLQFEADAANLSLTGSEVDGWTDLANGNDAAQLTSGDRPTYDATGGPGGTPRVAFGAQATGTTGHLDLPTSIKASIGPLTAYLVGQPNSNPSNSAAFDTISGRGLIMPSRLGDVAYFDTSYKQIAAGTTNAQTLCWVLQASGGEAFRDGSSLGSNTWSECAVSGTTVLGALATGSNPFDGWIAAFFLYGDAHDAGQRAAVEAYIAANFPGYGLT